MSSLKKVGILGGTFDPPHIGHLIIAQEVLESCQLDEIWFLPSYIPPHKNRIVTDVENRLDMVELAIAKNPFFKISLLEYERKGRSYTYDTLVELRNTYPDTSFYFIMGADMVNDLPNWYKYEGLGELATFVGVARPGYQFSQPNHMTILPVEIPEINISSSMIRLRVHENKNVRYFLCDDVKHYIEEKGLYEQG